MNPSLGWIVSGVLCSAGGHVCLKLGALELAKEAVRLHFGSGAAKWLLAGCALHVVALVLWVVGLKRVELSVAYPFIGLGMIIVSLVSWILLREQFSPTRLVGMMLVSSGIILLARS